jgi:sugar/nucleoside kinase (ribokinase family)
MSPIPAFDVLVVGNVGIDTNVFLPGENLDLSTEGHFTENLDCVGQAGGFTARGFAQLGYRTAFIGYVGDDFSGDFIRREFASDGINTKGLMIDPAGTSRSVNLVFPDGSRRSFYDGKSHLSLQPDLTTCLDLLGGSRLIHFSIPDWARQLLPIARDTGAVISCDLQDIPHPDDPYRQDFIHQADILFFSSANLESPAVLMEKILTQFPDKVLVSGMGKKGCALGTKAGIRFFPAVENDQPVVDTNGAGDSLAVGFLSAYFLEEKTLEDAVNYGQVCARFTCSLKSDSAHLITRQLLTDLLSA